MYLRSRIDHINLLKSVTNVAPWNITGQPVIEGQQQIFTYRHYDEDLHGYIYAHIEINLLTSTYSLRVVDDVPVPVVPELEDAIPNTIDD
jgi:hypothetical protein